MPEEPGANPSPPGQATVSGTPGAPGAPPVPRPFPAGLPMLPRLRLSACHRQAAGSTATEADWLDVLVRPGGAAALVIGHAEGPSGLIAAAAARLRAGLREQLHAGWRRPCEGPRASAWRRRASPCWTRRPDSCAMPAPASHGR
jgi:hypothetical protein